MDTNLDVTRAERSVSLALVAGLLFVLLLALAPARFAGASPAPESGSTLSDVQP